MIQLSAKTLQHSGNAHGTTGHKYVVAIQDTEATRVEYVVLWEE